MHLNDILEKNKIDPRKVLVLRHRPSEAKLNLALPGLAEDQPDLFNAYQQTQGAQLEKVMASMCGDGYIASFIGHQAAKALFVGLYAIGDTSPMTWKQYWQSPAHQALQRHGMQGFRQSEERTSILRFDLDLSPLLQPWKGKLVVGWPPPERSWWRRAHKNDMPVLSILDESILSPPMPAWQMIDASLDELDAYPLRWKDTLRHWRGIYYIFDVSDNKGYVGSAYGKDNIYGRWSNYATRGHGGNKLLKGRNPDNFRFSILQIVPHDMMAADVIDLENSWKKRLHTKSPMGLNDN